MVVWGYKLVLKTLCPVLRIFSWSFTFTEYKGFEVFESLVITDILRLCQYG